MQGSSVVLQTRRYSSISTTGYKDTKASISCRSEVIGLRSRTGEGKERLPGNAAAVEGKYKNKNKNKKFKNIRCDSGDQYNG